MIHNEILAEKDRVQMALSEAAGDDWAAYGARIRDIVAEAEKRYGIQFRSEEPGTSPSETSPERGAISA